MTTAIAEDIEVIESRVLTSEAADLIERTLWGTEGALYLVKNYPETLRRIPDLRYLFLKKKGRLIALRIVVPKTIHSGALSLAAVYHSLFIVDAAERGKGYGKQLARATLEWAGSTLHRRGV